MVKYRKNSNDINKLKPLKILLVGNSFSTDTAEYLFDICKSLDINITVGVSFDSGMGLEQTWNKLQNDEVITAYQKWDSENYRTELRPGMLKNIIKDETWDIVTFQQVSHLADKGESFQPYLSKLKEYVELNVSNNKIKFGLNMTWAFAETSQKIENKGYDNQMDLFNAIVSTYQKVMADMNFDLLIPTGTAIQNARTNSYLKSVGDDLTRDGSHLDKGIGRYITALVLFETVVSCYFPNKILENVDFYPEEENSKFLAYLSKIAAKNAVNNPFKVTDI